MRTNKKGFTLIELLAVIVILAIIALIATPIVMNVIKKSRQGAAQDSVYGLIKAAEFVYAESLLDVNGVPNAGYTFDCTAKNSANVYCYDATNDKALSYNGQKPSEGSIKVSSDGKVTLEGLKVDTFNCTLGTDGKVTCGE